MNEERTHGDCSAINDDEELPRPPSSEPVRFGYTNHRGEQATRRAIPVRIYWGATDYHPEGWIFEGYDVEKHAMRLYALRDCNFTSRRTFRERGCECPNCLQPVEIGQVVLPWDDAGEMHADCSNPYRLDVEQPADSPHLVILLGSPMRQVPLAGLAHGPVVSMLSVALERTVTGIGASFNRDTDSWGIYTMPGTVPVGTWKGYIGIDWVMDALRKHLWHERQPTVIEKLREAMKAYDEYVASCPFDPSKTTHPNSLDPCKVCSATMRTGCHRKASAGADVVTMVRRILDGDA